MTRPAHDTKKRILTVGQLIEGLSLMPQDAYVETEGCDCTGDAFGLYQRVDTRDGLTYVEISRPPNDQSAEAYERFTWTPFTPCKHENAEMQPGGWKWCDECRSTVEDDE